MFLRVSHLLLLAFVAVEVPCFAQTGTVTFYSIRLSAKQEVKAAVVPVGTVPFTGWIFDGNQRLAHAQGGRFMSFHLAAGEHLFTVPYHSNHPGKTTLHLKIEANDHYCVRLSAKYISGSLLVPVAYVDSQIEEVSCQQALKEAGNFKPIDTKRIDPAVRTELESSTSFQKTLEK